MSVHGSKRKDIPILAYTLEGSISDEMGEDRMRWVNIHRFTTLLGTVSVQRLSRFRWEKPVRYGDTLFIGGFQIMYEAPDFETYMTDDGEMLDRNLRRRNGRV